MLFQRLCFMRELLPLRAFAQIDRGRASRRVEIVRQPLYQLIEHSLRFGDHVGRSPRDHSAVFRRLHFGKAARALAPCSVSAGKAVSGRERAKGGIIDHRAERSIPFAPHPAIWRGRRGSKATHALCWQCR